MTDPMSRRRGNDCLSDLVLDRWVAGDLSDEQAGLARTHLDTCTACARRMEVIEGEAKAFSTDMPPLQALTEAKTKAGDSSPAKDEPSNVIRSRRWFGVSVVSSLAAAAAVVLVLVFPTQDRDGGGTDPAEPGVRLKGTQAKLGVFVKRGQRVEQGVSGDVVHPGDQLRFTYTVDETAWFAVFGVDGAGTVSIYHADDGKPQRIEPGRDTMVDSSFVLDDVLGKETMFGVFCPVAFSLEETRREIETVGKTAAAIEGALPGCRVAEMTLQKEPR